MKKIFTTLTCFCLIIVASAQNVGIGTLAPNASAALHISSSNKGMLFPNVYILNTSDKITVPAPAPNLVVFNTNALLSRGKGLYYNSGTDVAANWSKVGDLILPYASGTSEPGYAFNIQNYHASTSSIAIEGFCQNGKGIYGASVAGTGVYATSNTGNAIEISGKIKIAGTGQTPAPGKVLTSDANGNGTWQGAIAFRSSGIQPDGAAEFSEDVEKKVAFYTEEYDYGNNYNPSTVSPYSTFTAPVKGIYHFDVRTRWYDYADGNASEMRLKSLLNGITKIIVYDLLEFHGYWTKNTINTDVQLEAGEQVFVTLQQRNAAVMTLYKGYADCYFSGRLVMRL